MFYLLLTITLISLIIYTIVSFYPTNRSAYDRREQNIELFKAEKKNLELNPNLSQESINLLVNEREQILNFKDLQSLKINTNILRSETAVISSLSIINYFLNL